jgi:MOB kinase activator 1
MCAIPMSIHISRYEYLWEDGVKYKRPTKLPAPEYVDVLMNWAQSLLDDEAVFPNKIGTSI